MMKGFFFSLFNFAVFGLVSCEVYFASWQTVRSDVVTKIRSLRPEKEGNNNRNENGKHEKDKNDKGKKDKENSKSREKDKQKDQNKHEKEKKGENDCDEEMSGKKHKSKKDRKHSDAKCTSTSFPSYSPPLLDLTLSSCGFYCDGTLSYCSSSDEGCCSEGFSLCDASIGEPGGLFHCGKDSEYLGQCVESDILHNNVQGKHHK
jgi:DNA mismatch repair ATPase MutL